MEYITPANFGILLGVLAAIRGVGATIAVWTPNKKDDKFWEFVNAFLNIVGGNYGNAKNAD